MSTGTQIRQRARTYLQKGKFDKAIDEYKRLTGMETKNPNYFNELGDIYLKAGDSIQAVSNFEKAVVNYEKVALYNNAVAVCKKILRIIPDRGDTIYKLGELRAKQKLGGEARVYFSQYLDHILANADSAGPELNEKINGLLEFIPENTEILGKAADALVMIGIKTGALEIYSKLSSDAERAGESDQTAVCKAKIDLLKKSMTKDEIDLVENAISRSSGDGASESAESKEPPAPPADGGASDIDAEQEVPPAEASPTIDEEESADAEEAKASSLEDVSDTGTGEKEEYTVEEMEPDIEPESNSPAEEELSGEPEEESVDTGEMEEPVAAEEIEEEVQSGLHETAADDEQKIDEGMETDAQADEPAEEEGMQSEIPALDKAGEPHEDLSGLFDDARKADTAENLVEEITSDVEEDDFRSHYDLGMAYLEMALFTEAIKEFQIASRSEQIQIKSIEMIGHCFLMQNNPRLAVKQLLRGLELVKVSDSDSLGVHYNLGLAFEMLGDMEKAREHYEEVYIVDISFRDIADKMKKLSTVS